MARESARVMGEESSMHATKNPQAFSDPADALQRIDEVLRLSRSAIWEIDRDGVFTYISPSFEDILGYKPEELIGIRTIHDFYPPDLPDHLREETSREWIKEPREFTNSEVPLVAKSGRIVWVASDGKPVFDEEGNLAGFRGADSDITARKRQEDMLASREAQLMDLITAVPVPMAYTKAAGRDEMNVNQAFLRTFGYAPEEIPTVSDWFLRAYPDEPYRAEVVRRNEELLSALANGQRPAPGEYRITCRDGRVLDVEIDAALVGGRFVGTFVDISARKRFLDEAQAAEAELRRVLDSAPFAVAMTAIGRDFGWADPKAKVFFVNRRFIELFGYRREEIPTVLAWAEKALPDAEHRGKVFGTLDAEVQRTLAGGEKSGVGPHELRLRAKDGRSLDVVLRSVAVGDKLVTAFEDQTERNRIERVLREQREQLAHAGRVSALGQLAASLAHELDQPLGAILNNAEAAQILLAKDRPKTAELREILDDIISDDRRAGDVLDRIRAMVQKQPFRPEAVDVSKLFRDTVNLVQAVAAKKGIKIEASCEPGSSRVEGDRILLQQVLLNLLLNSIDAIGNRSDGLISLRAGEAGHDRIGISVSDNGGGVPSGEIPSLLQPFHTTKEGGLGMGLPMVNSIVEQHGGSLRLDNQPGRGLSVVMNLLRWQAES